MSTEQELQSKMLSVIDVRSPEEYAGGHVANSVNIPLQEIPNRLEELKSMKAPLVLCCASGNRSGQAQRYLAQLGLECINGGSWSDVNKLMANKQN